MRRGWVLLTVVGLLAAGPVVWAAIRQVRQQSEAMELVRRAATAHRRVSYSGELSWRRGRWERPVYVAHDAESGRTLYGWSVLWSYVASRPSTKAPDPVAWCRSIDALERNYRAEERATSRYLDRPVRLIRLEPRYEARPVVELTVDVETDLPLKVTTYHQDGSLGNVVAFRKIKFGPQAVKTRVPRHGRSRSIPLDRILDAVSFEPLSPAYLPQGFLLHECRVSGVSVRKLTFVYTDGISRLELTQGVIPTPAQMETEYVLRYGRWRARRRMRRYHAECKRALVQSDGSESGKITAKRRRHGRYQTYQLIVGNLDIELRSPANLPTEESARVLRSLRVR